MIPILAILDDVPAPDRVLPRDAKALRTYAEKRGWVASATLRMAVLDDGSDADGLALILTADLGTITRTVPVVWQRRGQDGWHFLGWPQGGRRYGDATLIRRWLNKYAPDPIVTAPRARKLNLQTCPVCGRTVQIVRSKWAAHDGYTFSGAPKECRASEQTLRRFPAPAKVGDSAKP